MSTKVKKCTCDHESQDKLYGPKNRLMNPMDKDGKYRCTVCGKEYSDK
jgi:hypothetical protein